VPPSITSQPADVTMGPKIGTDYPASFSATASGTPAPTLQWQISTNGGVSWTDITDVAAYSGTGSETLTLTGGYITKAMNGYKFRCVASNSGGSAASNPATLYVPANSIVTPAAPLWVVLSLGVGLWAILIGLIRGQRNPLKRINRV